MNEIAISIDNLSKEYFIHGEKGDTELTPVLKNVSLQIKEGERWGVIGKNGSGKSTLLKILSGIIKPSAGSAALYGSVGHILSVGDNFIPDLTGQENARIFFRLHHFSKSETEKALERTAEFAEIGNYFYSPVKTYSDGMYLRLAFAACLQLSANIMLIDEVISVGDAGFQEKLKEHFGQKVAAAETMVMVSHNPEEISAYCSHCLWLEKGAVKMTGTALDVISAYYYQLSQENWVKEYSKPIQETELAKATFIPVENELLKILNFEVTNANGTQELTYENGARFVFDIEKKQAGITLHPAVKIFDYSMNAIVMLAPQADSDADMLIKQQHQMIGIVHFETSLPPNVLSFGHYYAELVFSKDASAEGQFIEEAIKVTTKLHFEILQGQLYDYAGGAANIFVKPLCNWDINATA